MVKNILEDKKVKPKKIKKAKKGKNNRIDRILYPVISVMFLITIAIYVQNIVAQWNVTAGSYDSNTEMVINISTNMAGNMRLIIELFEEEAVKQANEILTEVMDFCETDGVDVEGQNLSDFLDPIEDLWVDIIIHDENNVVINEKAKTGDDTYKLTNISGARLFADGLMQKEEMNGTWITMSTQTDVIIKYIYQTTKDNKYTVEVVANVANFNSNIDIYDFETYANDLVEYFDYVDQAFVFNSEGYSTSKTVQGEAYLIPDEWRDIFEETLDTKQEVRVSNKSLWGYSNMIWTIPVNVSIGSDDKVFFNYVLLISFDNNETMNYFYAQAGINMFVSILAIAVILIIIMRNSSQYLNPLSNLTKSINAAAEGDYEKPAKVSGAKMMKTTIVKFNMLMLRIQEAFNMREKAYFQTLNALVSAIDASDEYTGGHCDRVMQYSLLLGEKIGLPAEEMNVLKFGAILHDVGKIGIDNSIVNKKGRLTDEEYAIIKTHPTIGLNIISNIEFLKDAQKITVEHHERWDGRGYPNGLKGEEISLLARIVALADTYDAMSSRRSYRDVLGKETIFNEIKNNAGTQFDPALAMSFIEAMNLDAYDQSGGKGQRDN